MRDSVVRLRRFGAAWAFFAVTVLAQPLGAASFGLQFFQTDWEAHVPGLKHSDWGLATLNFPTPVGLSYFNLVIEGPGGADWQVRNMPIIGHDPALQARTFGILFDLNAGGSKVTSLSYRADVSASPLTASPGSPVSTYSTVTSYKPKVGGLRPLKVDPEEDPTPYVGPDQPAAGPDQVLERPDMVNQEVGLNECGPGAFSNSLIWLDKKNDSISIPEHLKSIEGMKSIMGFDGDGVATDSWEKKRDALKGYVTTKFFTPGQIDKVFEEFQHGEDIEVWGQGHAATVSCMVKHADGTYSICIDHDTKQGESGGLLTQVLRYHPTPGRFLDSAYGIDLGEMPLGFVSESPVPEPSQYALLTLITGVVLLRARRIRRA